MSDCTPTPAYDAHAVGNVSVQVWDLACLAQQTSPAEALALLTQDEQATLSRARARSRQLELLYGRAQLRRILAEAVGARAQAIEFGSTPHGKPEARIPGGPALPAFNVSHAAGLWAIALAEPGRQVGLDVEVADPGLAGEVLAIARSQFAPAEYHQLLALPEAARQACFLRQWTLKEAMLKALGGGLSLAPDGLDVSGSACRIHRRLLWQEQVHDLHAHYQPLSRRCHLAVATQGELGQVNIQLPAQLSLTWQELSPNSPHAL